MAGWGLAAAWGTGAAAAGLALAEALVFVAAAAARGASPPTQLVARAGGVLFLWFNHVDVVFRARTAAPGGSLPAGFVLTLPVLGGTALAMWLLARGGRSVARRGRPGRPASVLSRGLHGTTVALPYAAACLGVSLLARLTIHVPHSPLLPSAVAVNGSLLGAVLWPLAIGVVAGFGGGIRATAGPAEDRSVASRVDSEQPRRERADLLLRASLSGGWRMLTIGLALSFAGLLALAAVHPGDASAYIGAMFSRGALPGLALVAANVLAVPTMAAWVLFPSMGSCLVEASQTSMCLLSFRHFPSSPGAGSGGLVGRLIGQHTGPAPVGYLLFLLVPVAAVVLGGHHAASRADARSRGEAATAGACAGVVFASLSAGMVLLSSVSGSVASTVAGTAAAAFRLGPDPAPSVLLALLWGVVGGALGALARGPSFDTPAEDARAMAAAVDARAREGPDPHPA